MNGIDLLKSIGDIDDDLIHEAYINTADSTPAKWYTTKPWLKWGSMAACLLCIGAVSISAYRMHQSAQNTSESAVAAYGIEAYNTPAEAFSQESDASMSEAPAAYLMDESADAECNLPTDSTPQLQAAANDSNETNTVPQHDWSAYTVISEYPGNMDAIYCYAAPAKGSYFLYHYLEETLLQNENEPYAYKVCINLFTYENNSAESADYIYGDTEANQELLTQECQRLQSLNLDVTLSADYQMSGILTKEELQDFPVNPEYGYVIGFANEQ